MKELMKKLGYTFKNQTLLTRALTRTSAIAEAVGGAAVHDFQSLEIIGDAQIRAALLLLLYREDATAADLHEAVVPLIANSGVMIQIAKDLMIDIYLIKGAGESITDKMRVDAIEAVIGAIAIDSAEDKKGSKAASIVKKLWSKYLQKPTMVPSSIKTIAEASSNAMLIEPKVTASADVLSPRTQRLFSGSSATTSIDIFKKYISDVPDIDRPNIGKRGDTVLMSFFRVKKIRPHHEDKIKLLLAAGANLDKANYKGQTARKLLKEKHPEFVAKLELMSPRGK